MTNLPAVVKGVALAPAEESQVLAVLRPAWEELAHVEDDYVRKCAVVGLMLNTVSAALPHGEFGAWMHRHLFPDAAIPEGKTPNDMPWRRRANRWMKAAENVVAIAQIGHVSFLDATDLANAVLGGGRKAPSAAISALLEKISQAVDGKTMAQLSFRFPSLDLAKGGDRQWATFLREKHPELIGKDGQIPRRGKVGKKSKEILAEYSAWLNKRLKPRTAKEKQEAARALLGEIDELLMSAVNSSVLGVLEPHEFQGTASVTAMWAKRLKDLANPDRK